MRGSKPGSDIQPNLNAHWDIKIERGNAMNCGGVFTLTKLAPLYLAFALAGVDAAAVAQTQQAPLSGTRLVTLGTAGGPLPRNDRAQPSNLLAVDGTLYLIDAGDGVTRRIGQAGYDFRQIGKIFLTHLHGDHTTGLATLLLSGWEFQRGEPVDIYGSGVDELVKGAIAYLTPNAEIRWAEGKRTPMAQTLHGHEVVPGVVYLDDKVKVIAVENTHFHFPPGSRPDGKYRSYSYRFETRDRVIVFMGDTGPSDAVTELAKNADVLVAQVTMANDVVELFKRNGLWQAKTPAEQEGLVRHMEGELITPQGVGQMAVTAGVKSVVMTHLGPTVDPEDDYQRYVDDVKKFYSGPVIAATDLMQF
jgi:ribonuclease BN (tRNA processing enzyme)